MLGGPQKQTALVTSRCVLGKTLLLYCEEKYLCLRQISSASCANLSSDSCPTRQTAAVRSQNIKRNLPGLRPLALPEDFGHFTCSTSHSLRPCPRAGRKAASLSDLGQRSAEAASVNMTDPAAEKAFRNTAERDAAIEVARADGMQGNGINQPRHIKFGCVRPVPFRNSRRRVRRVHSLVQAPHTAAVTHKQG